MTIPVDSCEWRYSFRPWIILVRDFNKSPVYWQFIAARQGIGIATCNGLMVIFPHPHDFWNILWF